jgi:hypothetical protein
MRAKEFINEGVLDDLTAVGRQAQQDMLGNLTQNIKQKITPDWYKKIAANAAAKRSTMQNGKMAQAWQSEWAKVVDKINQQHPTQPLTDDEYRGRFISWLEASTKVRVDPTAVSKYLTNQNLNSVGKYFTEYFIPRYLQMQTSVQNTIPDGYTLQANTQTQVGSGPATMTKISYKWNGRTQQWIDTASNKPVDTTSELYKQLTQNAMNGSVASGQTMKGRYGQTSNAPAI